MLMFGGLLFFAVYVSSNVSKYGGAAGARSLTLILVLTLGLTLLLTLPTIT